MTRRPERVAEALKAEISDILSRKVKDPRVGFVSVVSVDVTGDLRQAKIMVSTLGKKEEQEATMEALRSATGFIRSELGKRLTLRHTPEIAFEVDHSIKHGAHIDELLRKMKDDRNE